MEYTKGNYALLLLYMLSLLSDVFEMVCFIFSIKVERKAKIGNRYNQVPQLTQDHTGKRQTRNIYTMGCPPVRGDNPRAVASGLSYVQVDKHGITILYHHHQCRQCTPRDISC